jgi:hypothetical protein
MGLGFLAHQGLVTLDGLYRFLLMLPPLLVGQWLGARSFKSSDLVRFRRWVLVTLAVLALLSGGQGLLALWPA